MSRHNYMHSMTVNAFLGGILGAWTGFSIVAGTSFAYRHLSYREMPNELRVMAGLFLVGMTLGASAGALIRPTRYRPVNRDRISEALVNPPSGCAMIFRAVGTGVQAGLLTTPVVPLLIYALSGEIPPMFVPIIFGVFAMGAGIAGQVWADNKAYYKYSCPV